MLRKDRFLNTGEPPGPRWRYYSRNRRKRNPQYHGETDTESIEKGRNLVEGVAGAPWRPGLDPEKAGCVGRFAWEVC